MMTTPRHRRDVRAKTSGPAHPDPKHRRPVPPDSAPQSAGAGTHDGAGIREGAGPFPVPAGTLPPTCAECGAPVVWTLTAVDDRIEVCSENWGHVWEEQ